MKGGAGTSVRRRFRSVPGFLFGVVLLALGSSAFGFTLNVVDSNNDPIAVGYRWLLEEDTTNLVQPGVPSTTSISVSIGTSYSIPVATGTDNAASLARLDNAVILNPARRYVLTVLPDQPPDGPLYSMSAAKIAAGQKSATIKVLSHPVPTAQISVLVFMDNAFINGAPDVPAEPGLPGFRILVFDQAGEMSQDAFANPLGTVYLQTCDAAGQNPGTGTDACLDPDGALIVETLGNGIVTDNTGNVIIKNLYPGKYGIRAVPTDNQLWVQTSTIEGTPGIDTWVAANEPPQFVEAGFFNVHAFIGFVHPSNDPQTGQPLDYGPKFICPGSGCPTPGATVKGRVVSVHGNRPPLQPGLEIGRPVATAWVGLSDTLNGNAAVFAGPCDDNSEFTIPGVPPGTYTLTMWDFPLDQIIDYRTVVVTSDNAVNGNVLEYGDIPIFRWFGWFSGYVFADTNRNGLRDRNPATGEWLEASLPNQTVNLLWRDGSHYMTTTTDLNGYYEFNEVFPWYKWIVAERSGSDTGKRTGATIWVDNGGRLPVRYDPPVPVNFADPSTWYNDILTPQPQPENGGKGYRTVMGATNTMATFLYMEDTTWIDWGKTSFGPGENGGISGNVFYQAMITEVNPAQAGQTWWSTGVPRVKLNLYEDMDRDGVPDGPAIRTTFTEGWDDNFPTGCVDNVGRAQPFSPYVDCAEIIWTWQQVRPGVYDGIFSFDNLRNGTYIVEVIPPPAYELVKEEDQNIYFPGETFTPGRLAPIPGLENPSTVWPCVGAMHHIPEFETMFPEQQVPTINFPYDNTLMTPLCDRKQVTLTDGLNASGGFALFTTVPRAGRLTGLVTNDLVFEFNPANVRKGDKLGPSWMPISFKDWQGNEIARVYTDQWGQYETMLPSSFTFAAPDPSGIAPNIVTVNLNDPGPIPLLDNVTGLPVIDPSTGQTKMVTDPYFDPGYVQFASKWDVWPGRTTLIDTPIVPIAAFTQAHGKLDCELPDGTPVIAQVNGPAGGPYVPRGGTLLRISALTGVSVGSVPRDFGFGTVPGTVTLGDMPIEPVHWTNEIIVAMLPEGATTGQLMVTRGDNGHPTVMGITVTVGGGVTRVGGGRTIQSAIDSANPGDLILVPPGVYKENLILWKPVRLQGYGPWATAINAGFFDPVAQAAWTAKVTALTTAGTVLVVPGERADFFLEQGAGILVLSDNVSFRTNPSRIDGFLFTGAVQGSGIDINGYVQNLVVSNNRIQSNQGFFGGAIRLGTPSIVLTDALGIPVAGATTFNSNENSDIRIHHNHVDQNGSTSGGGGIGIFNGADRLQITQNFLCGNFSADIGGGILHLGLSDNVVIDNNVVLLNESFTEGGGILLTGEAVPAGAPATALNVGTGNVTVSRNRIQGNHAGSSGGGIMTRFVNGQDVEANPTDPTMWYRIDILNNMIVNNVGSHLAGGIAIADAVNMNIVHNTIAHNDSTATGTDAFGGPCNPQFQFNCGPEGPVESNAGGGSSASVAQAAGIVSQPHYANLQAVSGQTFSNPVLYNNVIWHNRAFSWDPTLNNFNGSLIPSPDNAVYWNLSVFGAAPGMVLNPRYCVLDNNMNLDNTVNLGTDNTNVLLDPKFVSPYVNVFEATSVGASQGNYVQVNYAPLALTGDYRLRKTSPAIDRAVATGGIPVLPGWPDDVLLNVDFDGLPRPFDVTTVPDNPSASDIGAAEYRE